MRLGPALLIGDDELVTYAPRGWYVGRRLHGVIPR
jgi:hypothetical protein